jgi:uncharacterized repeat protein (TIGR04138 family)
MTEEIDIRETVRRIQSRDDRFKEDAYFFVLEAIEFTLTRMDERRHLSAKEALDGMVAYARERYGMMGYAVIESWGLRESSDIGEAVFHLVNAGILAKRKSEAMSDFENLLDLRQVMENDYSM